MLRNPKFLSPLSGSAHVLVLIAIHMSNSYMYMYHIHFNTPEHSTEGLFHILGFLSQHCNPTDCQTLTPVYNTGHVKLTLIYLCRYTCKCAHLLFVFNKKGLEVIKCFTLAQTY